MASTRYRQLRVAFASLSLRVELGNCCQLLPAGESARVTPPSLKLTAQVKLPARQMLPGLPRRAAGVAVRPGHGERRVS